MASSRRPTPPAACAICSVGRRPARPEHVFAGILWIDPTGTVEWVSRQSTGADEDLFEFAGTFGGSTSGTFSMRQDLTALGIASGEDIGSLHIVE